MIKSEAIIIAAGKGSRLGLPNKAKAMAEVNGKPLLRYMVKALYGASFAKENITCVIGHKGQSIVDYFGKDLKYVEQEVLNGNGGALKLGMANLSDNVKTVLVLQGDDGLFLSADKIGNLVRFHERRRADVTIYGVPSHNFPPRKTSIKVTERGRVLDLYSGDLERDLTFAGICIFDRKFLDENIEKLTPDENNKGEIVIPQLFRIAFAEGRRVFAYKEIEKWVGINTPEELEQARYEFNSLNDPKI